MSKSYIKAYGRVPIGLILQKPKASVIYVYAAIDSFQGGNDSAFPKIEKICERSGLKPSAVKAAVAWLVKSGWVVRTRRIGKSNVYVCLHEVEIVAHEPEIHEPYSVAHEQPHPVADDEPHGVANIIKAQDKKTTEKNTEIVPSILAYQDIYLKVTGELPKLSLQDHERFRRVKLEYHISEEQAVEYIRMWGKKLKEEPKYWSAALSKFDGDLIARLDKERAIEKAEDEELLAEARRLFPDYVPKSQRQAV